jgi:methionyl-tRNA synthetase
MPTAARAIHGAIQSAPEIVPWPSAPMSEFLSQLEPGQKIAPPDVLFAKIADEQIAEWRERFRGTGA